MNKFAGFYFLGMAHDTTAERKNCTLIASILKLCHETKYMCANKQSDNRKFNIINLIRLPLTKSVLQMLTCR